MSGASSRPNGPTGYIESMKQVLFLCTGNYYRSRFVEHLFNWLAVNSHLLKGFGHGVRKIQSEGKGRAVVIHTATGRQLEELAAVLGDVQVSASEEDLDA